MCKGTLPVFTDLLSKADDFRDFLYAYSGDEIFSTWGLLFKKKCSSVGGKFFLYEMTRIITGGKSENVRVVSPESVPFLFSFWRPSQCGLTLKREEFVKCLSISLADRKSKKLSPFQFS